MRNRETKKNGKTHRIFLIITLRRLFFKTLERMKGMGPLIEFPFCVQDSMNYGPESFSRVEWLGHNPDAAISSNLNFPPTPGNKVR